ncbi:unnamed protein product, partial [marine sediment metagenome]
VRRIWARRMAREQKALLIAFVKNVGQSAFPVWHIQNKAF